MEKIWQPRYPKGIPSELPPHPYKSILDVFEEACRRFSDLPAFTNMGKTITYKEVDVASRHFAAFLQRDWGLKRGDRIALQMPNLLQYPIAVFGALRAGLIIVNTNPLYTPREMEHQFKDAGVTAVIIVANFAKHLQEILPHTLIKHVMITELGDLLPLPKKWIVNAVVKYVKRMVPSFQIPHAVSFNQALKTGAQYSYHPEKAQFDDVALLQYTGGTTGVAKGAMLTHGNIISNLLQCHVWMKANFKDGKEIAISPLPFYHIFSFTVNCLLMMRIGAHNIIITNPRDLPSMFQDMRRYPFTFMSGVNTLFNGMLNHPMIRTVNFKHLKFSVAGGMALQKSVAERWLKTTNSKIIEGFGLTETSPVISINPLDGTDQIGTIGIPCPSTEYSIRDEQDQEVPNGKSGELWVRGPQVMKGYWNKPEETAKVLTPEGWFKTGDIAVVNPDGFFKIVDRKKDMILVSGFNVYPNEVEEVASSHPSVLECAAVGIPNEHSGEAVKLFVVKKDESLTEQELRDFCKERLTNYKVPRHVEFRTELPKSNVGKILRRELRKPG